MATITASIVPSIRQAIQDYGVSVTVWRYNATTLRHEEAETVKMSPPTRTAVQPEPGTLIQAGDYRNMTVLAEDVTQPLTLSDQLELDEQRYAIRSVGKVYFEDAVLVYDLTVIGGS